MESISNQRFVGERALFAGRDLAIAHTVFADGESPLKHSSDIGLDHAVFEWKYPLWYSGGIAATNSALTESARAGIWYTRDVAIDHSTIAAPKTFRRSQGIHLEYVSLPNAAETLWACRDVTLHHVMAAGDYFAMNSSEIRVDDFQLIGNYSFDGCRDVEVDNAYLLSKDAFWNCENVVVKNSLIVGEYIGWNSRNLTFIDCTIESLQGLCFIENLVMRGCRLLNTTLAFEYSTVDAEIVGSIDSIINPTSGIIRCESVGTLVLDPGRIDPAQVQIITSEE
ncbi:MAG: DUF3737 family protein [Propionibacteriaceae bacterium]|nr:DUF3737 family protein [Propionibacteriaceae bacterium]